MKNDDVSLILFVIYITTIVLVFGYIGTKAFIVSIFSKNPKSELREISEFFDQEGATLILMWPIWILFAIKIVRSYIRYNDRILASYNTSYDTCWIGLSCKKN